MITMKEKEIQEQAAKQVKINESTRKSTLEIYGRLVDTVKTAWEFNADVETGTKMVSDLLFNYPRKEGKEAVNMIMTDDMDTFKDERKVFRVFAQKILKDGKDDAKERIKENDKVVKNLVKGMEAMEAEYQKPATPHPFGTGMKRVENEIRHRPRALFEDLKFRIARTVGIY